MAMATDSPEARRQALLRRLGRNLPQIAVDLVGIFNPSKSVAAFNAVQNYNQQLAQQRQQRADEQYKQDLLAIQQAQAAPGPTISGERLSDYYRGIVTNNPDLVAKALQGVEGIPLSEVGRLGSFIGSSGTALGRVVGAQDQMQQTNVLDTPFSQIEAIRAGHPEWAGLTPRQVGAIGTAASSFAPIMNAEANTTKANAALQLVPSTEAKNYGAANQSNAEAAQTSALTLPKAENLQAQTENTKAQTNETNTLLPSRLENLNAKTENTKAQTNEITTLLPSRVENLNAQTENTQAKTNEINTLLPGKAANLAAQTENLQARTESQQLQNELTRQFGTQMERAKLRLALDQAAREEVGIKLDEAQLDRYTQLTGPIVQKAVADALSSSAKAQVDQATVQTAIDTAKAQLQDLLTKNKINEEEYQLLDRTLDAQVEKAMLGVEYQRLLNNKLSIEANNLAATAQFRAQQEDLQLQSLQLDIQKKQHDLALAKRVDPIKAQQLEAELQATQLAAQQAAYNLERDRNTAQLLGNGADPKVLDSLYETEVVRPYEKSGMWLPDFDTWLEWKKAGEPVPFYTLLQDYDQKMRQEFGGNGPQQGLPQPWMAPDVRNAYNVERMAYQAGGNGFATPRPFVPLAVWYANSQSKDPLPSDVLTERWNRGVLSFENGKIVDKLQPLIKEFGSPQAALEAVENSTDDLKQKAAAKYGVSVQAMIDDLTERAGGVAPAKTSQGSGGFGWLKRFFGGG